MRFAVLVISCLTIATPAWADGDAHVDVESFINRMDHCEGFWEADGSESPEAKTEIEKAKVEFECESLPCDYKDLMKKYDGQKSAGDIKDVMDKIVAPDSPFYAACKDNS
jgi:hypothetical protein